MTDLVQESIARIVADNPVVLFMKGAPSSPRCGFSAAAAAVMAQFDVPLFSIDVLENESIRQGVKAFSEWPTFPQLYIKGEFIGGADIMREMFQSGELKETLIRYGLVF